MTKRFWAIFKARNLEFFRDRASLSWSIVFPVLIVVGFAFIFGGEGRAQYKVGLIEGQKEDLPELKDFLSLEHIEFVRYQDAELAKQKIQQHSLDLLVSNFSPQYWVNETSPKGYIVEQLLLGSTENYIQNVLSGRKIRYLDWVIPGVLGMNMMFSCLFGVGYVIVRYRKNGVLKRLKATPLSATEFILAQISSRLVIVMFISSSIFLACDLMFDFYMLGSYLTLFFVATLGAFSMIALGLLVSCRMRSEELTGGLLNMVSWPMMILSGVWFSMEGSPVVLQQFAQILPLTHLVGGARAIMTEGATFSDISYHIAVLTGMTAVFLTIAVYLFRWEGDGR